jgi:prostaglandin-H2 D-isomerase / glutathione transferase
MPQYKLTYFDLSASRGEDCRLALHAAGVEFEDNRLKRPEWPAVKPKTPYGSVPVLETAGKPPLAQSNAILAYVGRSYGLHPSDPWQAALHEAVMASVEEFRAALAPSGQIQDPELKRRAREEFASGYLQTWAAQIEAQIQGPFLDGEKLCVADIKLFTMVNSIVSGVMDHVSKQSFEPFTKLTQLHKAVAAHPRVAEWRARFQ